MPVVGRCDSSCLGSCHCHKVSRNVELQKGIHEAKFLCKYVQVSLQNQIFMGNGQDEQLTTTKH